MERRFLRINEAMKLYGIGKNKMYDLGKQAEATIKYGKVLWVDTEKINNFLERNCNK